MEHSKRYSLILGGLALLFLGRVIGQVVVVLWQPVFLPPMEEWYSGLLPYPILLPFQIGILVFQAAMSWQLWKGAGRLTGRHPGLGRGLKWFSLVYFLVMVARYVISMWQHPEWRWFGHTIPIWFHFTLALYVYLLSRYWRGLRLPFVAAPIQADVEGEFAGLLEMDEAGGRIHLKSRGLSMVGIGETWLPRFPTGYKPPRMGAMFEIRFVGTPGERCAVGHQGICERVVQIRKVSELTEVSFD